MPKEYIDIAINALGKTIFDKDFEIQRLKWEIEDLKKVNKEFAEKIRYLTEKAEDKKTYLVGKTEEM